MAARIDTLIDKEDNFTLIRNEIAAILAVEVASQKVLASAALKDPDLWDFAVYSERSDPWIIKENNDCEITGPMPLVNVYFDQTQIIPGSSNNIDQQTMNGSFIIDVYAAKNAKELGLDVLAADELTALEAQRILKLVRNILMAAAYENIFSSVENENPVAVLGIVKKKTFSQIQMFRPQIDDRPVENVIGARLVLQIEYLEFSPQVTPPIMELLSAECTRGEDGKVFFKFEEAT